MDGKTSSVIGNMEGAQTTPFALSIVTFIKQGEHLVDLSGKEDVSQSSGYILLNKQLECGYGMAKLGQIIKMSNKNV
jgi:hypothetical protein